jgi:ATP-dependent Clp protease ATP-binding subunit ClpX
VEAGDLVKYGLIPELVGRLPVIASLDELDEKALIEILTKPKNAIVRQFQTLFGMENVELEFTDDALKAIAHRAIARKTGARGLRSILENVLLDAMFDIPSKGNVAKAVVTKETVEEGKPLELVLRA